jgi:hypothetical protein
MMLSNVPAVRSCYALDCWVRNRLEGRWVLYRVTIILKNGVTTTFSATEFDVDLDPRIPVTADTPHRYSYKDANGEEVTIYLTVREVAAITVEPTPTRVDPDLVDPGSDV